MSITMRAITEGEAAELLGLKVATLRAWRHNKKGPRFVKYGRAVRYLPDDLTAFIEASRVDTESSSVPDHQSVELSEHESA